MSVTTTSSPELQELSEQVQSLAMRVAGLENRQTHQHQEDLKDLLEINQRVLAFTDSIFGGHASIEQSSDPETDEEYFVVNTKATGEVAEILRLDREWHRRLAEPAEKWAFRYRLSLDVS